jgi:cytochrome c-type biogenesis protein CcmE
MKKRARFWFILLVMASLSLSAGLALYALQDNISYFKAPLDAKDMPEGRVFRLGGLVKKGSLEKRNDGLAVRFVVTDYKGEVTVSYKGILPDLFREGQGVIAKGAFGADGVFTAEEILAKHDEKYMPPEVVKAIRQ